MRVEQRSVTWEEPAWGGQVVLMSRSVRPFVHIQAEERFHGKPEQPVRQRHEPPAAPWPDGNQQGEQGNQQGGNAGQQFDKNQKQQGGQGGRQIDDNQDDMGRDVNNPSKTSNDINKKM